MTGTIQNNKEDAPNLLPTGMAFKYETAYSQLWAAEPEWLKSIIIDDPLGRHSKVLAHQAAILAEKGEITKREREQGDMTFDPTFLQQVEPLLPSCKNDLPQPFAPPKNSTMLPLPLNDISN